MQYGHGGFHGQPVTSLPHSAVSGSSSGTMWQIFSPSWVGPWTFDLSGATVMLIVVAQSGYEGERDRTLRSRAGAVRRRLVHLHHTGGGDVLLPADRHGR